MKSHIIPSLFFVLFLFLCSNQAHSQTSFIDIPHPIEVSSERYDSFMVAGADGHMFIISNEGYFFRSTDDGLSWSPFETPFEGHQVFAADGSHDGILVLSVDLRIPSDDGNTWISEDNGMTWRGLGNLFSGQDELFETKIWIKPESITIKRMDVLFWTSTDYFTIYDFDGNWTSDIRGEKMLPNGSEMSIIHGGGVGACLTVCSWIAVIDPTGDEKVIPIYEESDEDIEGFYIYGYEILSNEHWLFTTSFGLHITEDAGETWIVMDEGDLQGAQNIIRTEYDELIMLTSPTPLLSSRDDGQNWQVISLEENHGVPSSRFVNSSNGYLYVYANSDFILRSEYNYTSLAEDISDIPGRIELHQNYPNPFNPTTIISFDLSEPVQTTLEVYDIQGRLVEQLISSRTLPQGTHRISWDSGNRASGLYVYRLRAGDETLSQKMLLLK